MSVRETGARAKSAPGEGRRKGERKYKPPAVMPTTFSKRPPITVSGKRVFNVKIVVNSSQSENGILQTMSERGVSRDCRKRSASCRFSSQI